VVAGFCRFWSIDGLIDKVTLAVLRLGIIVIVMTLFETAEISVRWGEKYADRDK